MLRILFTSDDLARTRIAAAPDPLWELTMGLQMLRRQRGDLLFNDWRRASLTTLTRRMAGDQLRLLIALTPTIGYFPDFLTPAASAHGLESGLEAIRSTPRSILAGDLGRLANQRRLPPGVSALARGDVTAVTGLAEALRTVHQLVIAPHEPRIGAAVERDRHIRLRAVMNGGAEGLLTSLRPMADYSSGELRVPAHRDQEVQLAGRGLTLIPSFFNLVQPLTLFDPDLPPVLIYPVERPPETILAAGPTASGNLARLIGPTRAAVLLAVGTGCSTKDLATRARIAPASASEHAAVLRAAGLITSHREGPRMVHLLTRLGRELLRND